MKRLFLLTCTVLISLLSQAAIFYISPTGNDATGNGSLASPWKTLFKATSTVRTAGDIIHVNPGTYIETQQSYLAVGVSLEGEGVTSVIQSTITGVATAVLWLESASGSATNGNQYVANLKFDGRYVSESNKGSWGGIRVNARSNVTIRNCTITGFYDNGVIFSDHQGYNTAFPANSAFCLNNKFHDNILTNCATYYPGNYGTGGLEWGGQQDFLCYNNTIQQNERVLGYNGWPIKYYGSGALRNMKFYNNRVIKIPLVGGYMGNGGWTFAWEGYQQYGVEIYNNTFTGGSIDFNETRPGTIAAAGSRGYAGAQPYGAWIHDNTFNLGAPNSGHWTPAIQLEFYSENVIIERNTITNYSVGILHSGRTGDNFINNVFRNNLIANIGWQEPNGGAIIIQNDANNGRFDNNKIYNNTMTANPSYKPFRLLEFDGSTATGATGANNEIINNIFVGASAEAISIWGANKFTNLKIQNNNFYQNGTNGVLFQQGLTPGSGYINSGNTTQVPGFVGGTNYTLTAGSLMIDAGINVGLPYNGAAPDKGYAEYASGGNVSPSANAGADQTITLPTSSVTLTGSGTDPDGSISTYAWTKVSGPAGGTIASPAAASTNITGLTAGTYVFRLTVTDNQGATATDDVQVIVNNAPNVAPTANAGADQAITLPTSSVTLTGTGTDTDGTIASYAWSKVSGPAGGTIATPAAASTNITGLTAGTYVYRLTVTDNRGATATDDVQIVVNSAPLPPPNAAPTANAGADQAITLPASSVTLTGTGTDTDGTIASYAWSKVSGPAGGTIATPAAASTNITGLTAGTYVFRLTVTDNGGASATDDVQIIVNSAPPPPPPANVAPTANAGADQAITLPTSSVTLNGSGTDTDGTIASYAWSKVSGPAGGTIATPAAASTNITGLTAGTYVYRLTVTDNGGAAATDDVQIIVNNAPPPPPPANVAPTANAGADQVITLPTSSVTLNGSGTDPDGTIASYAWTKVSGPAGGTIATAGAASTDITGMVAGTYVYRLTVTDNGGAAATDDVQIIVNSATAPVPPANNPPTANAGANQSITLPTSSVTLTGTGTDTDGTISSYAWIKVSGPTGGTIASPATASTGVSGLTAGTYIFRLTVTDNNGATGVDEMEVVVNNAPTVTNIPPISDAGSDINLMLPDNNTARLNGNNSKDPDGFIAGWSWKVVQGPAGSTITNSTTATPSLTVSRKGTYTIELMVTDNGGLSSKSQVKVNVGKINKTPRAMTTYDTTTVKLPVQNTLLEGSNSYDADGTITSYQWSYVSGPSTYNILTPDSANTVVSNLKEGTYQFELAVSDEDSAIDKKTVTIIVKNSTSRLEILDVKLYPNPAVSNVNVTINADVQGRSTLTLFDVRGMAVYSEIFEKTGYSFTRNIKVSSLRKGTYFVVVQVDGSTRMVRKLLIQ